MSVPCVCVQMWLAANVNALDAFVARVQMVLDARIPIALHTHNTQCSTTCSKLLAFAAYSQSLVRNSRRPFAALPGVIMYVKAMHE